MTVRLGPLVLQNPWILAPMAGVSEWPYRVIALSHGAAATPTELISARALIEGTPRSERYMARDPSEAQFWVQLFGGDAAVLRDGAAAAVERGATALDLNMGCPVRKVTKSGAGSALLSDPSRAAEMVRALVDGGGVPVTVKIRAGWDENSLTFVELAKACADAGACAIAMHARTRVQGYSGKAHWPWIARLVEKSPIPVIGNGDAFTAADARRMVADTGCRAVMIGRGALGNPWVFAELTGRVEPVSGTERARVVLEHFESNLRHVGAELEAVRRFRKHLVWYGQGIERSREWLQRVLRMDEAAQVRAEIAEFFPTARSGPRGEVVFEERKALG
ncbi:MAG: tRNA dihydrouridine synthase DusB [Myxococcota bacterium]